MTRFNYVEVGYFSTLYNRVERVRTCDSLVFDNGKVKFTSGGHGYELKASEIRYIEPIHEEV